MGKPRDFGVKLSKDESLTKGTQNVLPVTIDFLDSLPTQVMSLDRSTLTPHQGVCSRVEYTRWLVCGLGWLLVVLEGSCWVLLVSVGQRWFIFAPKREVVY